jgi:hypothetical protein
MLFINKAVSHVVVASSDAEIYSVVQGDTKNNKQALPEKKAVSQFC